MDTSVVSDLDSSNCSRTSQCSLIEDILDDHLALPAASIGRSNQNTTTRGRDQLVVPHARGNSLHRDSSPTSTSFTSIKPRSHSESAPKPRAILETSRARSIAVKSSGQKNSIKHEDLSSAEVDDHDQTLVNSIALLEVDESLKGDLLKNLNLTDIKPTISIETQQPKSKSTHRRSGSLDSHGSGSTDSILNEAEEQIRMTTSGLDLLEIGLSTGTLFHPSQFIMYNSIPLLN